MTDLRRRIEDLLRHCENEVQSIYCGTDGRLDNSEYARIAAYEELIRRIRQILESGGDCDD